MRTPSPRTLAEALLPPAEVATVVVMVMRAGPSNEIAVTTSRVAGPTVQRMREEMRLPNEEFSMSSQLPRERGAKKRTGSPASAGGTQRVVRLGARARSRRRWSA